MGRNRKWVLEDDLSEAVWKRILRGPRPPSHKWPVAQGQGRSTSAAHRHRSGRQPPTVVTEPPRPNRTPEAVAEAAAEEVVRLESAVAALGEGNPLAKPLLAALKVARSKVNVPVSVQIEMSEKYLARARKRLVVANEELEKAVEKKNSCTSDVEATELRLARLRASVPTPMNPEPAAVAELQGRIDGLIRERDALRSAVPPLGDPAAMLPASGAEEVNMLRTSVRAELTRQRAGDPSALMSTLIDQGDSLARERYNPLT